MEGEERNEQELKDSTKRFALQVIKLVESLPNTIAGRAIGNELVSSVTFVGANYRAAFRSRSMSEFVAKIGIMAEKADETAFWMEIIADVGFPKESRTLPLRKEAEELTAIFIASGRTAKSNIAQSKISNPKS